MTMPLTDDLQTAALDRHLAELLSRLAGNPDAGLEALLQRLSAQTSAGHMCLDLSSEAHIQGVAPAILGERLLACGLAGVPGEFKPLVLDARGRLYLYRYWNYEQRLAADLRARAGATVRGVDMERLRCALTRLFSGEGADWQKNAAAVAVLKRLCILSGGPGTGKTTTVVRVLALLAELTEGAPLRMGLAAPTGKAAARMQEAVRAARDHLPVDAATRACIPETATTIHRLLGGTPESVHFRHHREHPLPLDVLVVDEASMVDVALMTKLTDALPAQARLVLVGDKDQLSSVEPGAVLGSLCAEDNAYTPAFAALLEAATGHAVPLAANAASPLRDTVVLLERSHRFGSHSGIAQLARAVRAGDADSAIELLHAEDAGDVQWRPELPPAVDLLAQTGPELDDYALHVRRADAEAAFRAFGRFRVLAGHRSGPAGVQWLNAVFERAVAARVHVHPTRGWFPGRAVMVSRNHHALRLFNGDIGIALPGPDGDLRVAFAGGDGPRWLAPPRLPEHEPAYALTVHKSQGSEFDTVLVLLPRADSPLLTRELLYTAVTRARERVVICGSEAAVRTAIARRSTRTSGLRDACWNPGADT